ncbi:hypothetical protein TKK_0010457 [Trichogramma kaykai]|uniref:Uncharacterized protein n=1 Tax=Trichogramma kaykai TaxID=54128 RepID=A0ABD2WXH5_9HYME
MDKFRASLNLCENESNLAGVNDSPMETPVIRPGLNSYSSASTKASTVAHSKGLSKKSCPMPLRQKAPTPEKTLVIPPPSNSYSSASSKASTVACSKGLSKKSCPTPLRQKARTPEKTPVIPTPSDSYSSASSKASTVARSKGSSKKSCPTPLSQKAPTPEKTPVIPSPSNSYSSASSKASTVARSKGLSKKSCPTPLRQKATGNGYRGSLKKVSDSRDIGKLKNLALRARLNAEVFNYIASTEGDNISLPNLSTEEYHNDHNLDNPENEGTSNVVRENSYTSKVKNGCKVFDVIKLLERQPRNNEGYVKKVNIVEYDTDNYNDEPGQKMSPFKKWTEEKIDTETGDTIKKHMFHIHYGISVPHKNWKKALKAKSDYGFLRELIDYIWDPQIFLKKSIQPQRTADKESREKVTPKKKKP